MAQMQNIIDFPPAPKLDPLGRLDPAQGDRAGAGRRAGLHGQGTVRRMPHPADVVHRQQMHDLKLERFYEPGETVNDFVMHAGRADQDLHAARHQGLAALPARRPAA